MSQEKRTGKRPVPLKAFLKNKIEKDLCHIIGTLLVAVCPFGSIAGFILLLCSVPIMLEGKLSPFLVVGGLVWGMVLFFTHLGSIMVEEAEALASVELLTPSRVSKLPAEETLVRPVSDPTPEPEKVLLRAAQTTGETPPDQLLRPGS